MATSVLQQQILAKRKFNATMYKFGGGRRVQSLSTRVNSIADKTQAAEDEDVINRYSDGLISNDDFLSYLNGILKRPDLPLSDRSQVENKIRDTKQKIQAEQLEAAYNQAPDKSSEKAIAAQAVANYWKSTAEGLIPGTPAYSVALQNYGTWTDRAVTIKAAAETEDRRTQRALKELTISAMDTTKSDSLFAKAQAYQELSNEAAQDGDQIEAAQMMTKANSLIEQAGGAQVSEEKLSIMADFRKLKNAWHDGTISQEDLGEALGAIDGRATAIGYDGFYASFDTFVDKVQKDIEKGLKRSTFAGLPTVQGRGRGSGGSSVINTKSGKTWEEEDEYYVDKMREVDRMMKLGMIDPDAGTAVKTLLMMERGTVIQDRISSLEGKAYGDNIPYQGKKKDAGDLMQTFENEIMLDASSPGGYKIPILKEGLADILELQNPQLTASIQGKLDELQKSGEDLQSLSPYDVVGKMKLDFGELSNKAYVQKIDDLGRIEVEVVDKNSSDFVPGVTHVYDGALWHEVEGGKLSFDTEEMALAEMQRRGIEGKPEETDSGKFEFNVPESVRIVNADGTADIWARGGEGQAWSPQDPDLAKMVQEIRDAKVIKPDTGGVGEAIPLDPTAIASRDEINTYYPQVEKYRKVQEYGQQATQEETKSRILSGAHSVGKTLFPAVQSVFQPQEFKEDTQRKAEAIRPSLTPYGQKALDFTTKTIPTAVESAKQSINRNFLQPTLNVASNLISRVPEQTRKDVKTILLPASNPEIVQGFKSAYETVRQKAQPTVDKLKGWVKGIVPKLNLLSRA